MKGSSRADEEERAFAFKKALGRPGKLTRDLIDKITKAVAAGNYLETAAAYAGVSKPVVFLWLKMGHKAREEKRRTLERTFLDLLEKARAESEVRDVTQISRAGANGAWKACAWRLERKAPDRWGKAKDAQDRALIDAQISLLQARQEALQAVQQISDALAVPVADPDAIRERLKGLLASPALQALLAGRDIIDVGPAAAAPQEGDDDDDDDEDAE